MYQLFWVRLLAYWIRFATVLMMTSTGECDLASTWCVSTTRVEPARDWFGGKLASN